MRIPRTISRIAPPESLECKGPVFPLPGERGGGEGELQRVHEEVELPFRFTGRQDHVRLPKRKPHRPARRSSTTGFTIRAVTFDVGGTLIEPFPSVGHIYAEAASGYGLRKISAAELNRRFAAAWRAQPNFAHTRAAWADIVDETFRGLVRRPPSETFFDDLFNRFSLPDAWRIFEDVFPALEFLGSCGVKLAIISNWDDRLRPLLRRLELARWFKPMVISCEVGFPKPRPEPFQKAAEQLCLPPDAILHIGDSLQNDVRAARSAGFHALLLRRKPGRRTRGSINSLQQLTRMP